MGLGGIVSGAKNAVSKAAGTVATKASEGVQKVKEGASKVAEGVEKAKSTAVNQAKDTFESAKKAGSTAVNKTKELAEAGATKVNNAADKAADAVKSVTPEPVKKAASKVADLHTKASDAINSKLSDGAKKAVDVAGRAAGAVGAGWDAVNGNPKALLTGAGSAAGELATKSGPVAKAAGRFVPGANVAAAAWDTANFVKDLNDKDANVTDKVLSGITAGGSILGATNIPVVSQVGSAVSTVSDIANSFFGNKK